MFQKTALPGDPLLATCPLCGQVVVWIRYNMSAENDRKTGDLYPLRPKWMTTEHEVETLYGTTQCSGSEKDIPPSALKQ